MNGYGTTSVSRPTNGPYWPARKPLTPDDVNALRFLTRASILAQQLKAALTLAGEYSNAADDALQDAAGQIAEVIAAIPRAKLAVGK